MPYTARISEYVHNAATTQGVETEGVEVDNSKPVESDVVQTKVVSPPEGEQPQRNEDVETK